LSSGIPITSLINESKEKLPLTDIYCLLANALGKEKEFLFSHPEYTLSRDESKRWQDYKKRRLHGEPCAYIIGHQEFFSLLFTVDKHTMIPRPETELLVEEVMHLNPDSLLDIGTGCGNIAVTVKYYNKQCKIVAVDVCENALLVAKKNALSLLGENDINFIKSDYFNNIPDNPAAKFDVIVSNPPYVKSEEIYTLQKEIREHEPLTALDGGRDGLDAYRLIISRGKQFIKKGGRLVLEIDERLINGISSLALKNNYIIMKTAHDLSGRKRMMVLEI
jgi:release factor glutamine methyltransferase